MALLNMNTTWTLDVTTPELRLILKALGGRLTPAEIEEARLLGDRMTEARAKSAAEVMRWSDRLLKDVSPQGNVG